jgi:hypothetical protein
MEFHVGAIKTSEGNIKILKISNSEVTSLKGIDETKRDPLGIRFTGIFPINHEL